MSLFRERSCSSQSQHGLLVSGHSRRPTPSSRTSTSRLPLASLPTPDLAGRSPLAPPRPFGLLGYAPRHLPCSPLIFDRRYHDFLWLFAHNTPPSSLGVPVTSKIKSCCFHISRDVIVTRASMPTDDDDLLLELAWLILMISFSRDVKPGARKAERELWWWP